VIGYCIEGACDLLALAFLATVLLWTPRVLFLLWGAK
jgi:hypothetical protein